MCTARSEKQKLILTQQKVRFFRTAKAHEQELARQERKAWGSRGADPKQDEEEGLDRLSLVLFDSSDIPSMSQRVASYKG